MLEQCLGFDVQLPRHVAYFHLLAQDFEELEVATASILVNSMLYHIEQDHQTLFISNDQIQGCAIVPHKRHALPVQRYEPLTEAFILMWQGENRLLEQSKLVAVARE